MTSSPQLSNTAGGRRVESPRVEIAPEAERRGQMRLSTEIWLPRPIDEVFAFFADAANLEAITPPCLQFRIVSPQPVVMAAGTLIDYRLRLRLIPIRWRSEISLWEPPHRFVDRQVRGPYRLWEHTHTFEPVDGGTQVTDSVLYAVTGGRLIEKVLVWRDLQRIFEFRGQRLLETFADVRA